MENNKNSVAFWLKRKAWVEGYILKYNNQLAKAKLDLLDCTDHDDASFIQADIDRFIQHLGEGYMATHLFNAIKNLTRLGQERKDDLYSQELN